jgi:hypothetical protein
MGIIIGKQSGIMPFKKKMGDGFFYVHNLKGLDTILVLFRGDIMINKWCRREMMELSVEVSILTIVGNGKDWLRE